MPEKEVIEKNEEDMVDDTDEDSKEFSPNGSPLYPHYYSGHSVMPISRSTSTSEYNDNNVTETYDGMLKGFLG